MSSNNSKHGKKGQEDRPRNIVLEVTSACNNDCLYCYNVWKSPQKAYPTGELPLQKVLQIIDGLIEDLPLESIAISGGEPFLRPDLSQIVSHIWSHGTNSVIITNGTMLTKKNIELTSGANNYELPLLSYRKEVHNKLTKRDCFNSVINGMRNIKECDKRFAIAFIATRLNYKDLEKTVELAIAFGAEGILYNRMNVSAHNYPYAKKLLPTPDIIKENLDILETMGKEYGLPISSSIPIQPCLIDTRGYKHIHFGFCPLAGKDSYFTVDPMGNLRVCNHSSMIIGNLLEKRFFELYKHPYIHQFMTTIPKSCKSSCPSEFLDRCQGGCKEAAKECFGSMEVNEPFLEYNLQKQDLLKLSSY